MLTFRAFSNLSVLIDFTMFSLLSPQQGSDGEQEWVQEPELELESESESGPGRDGLSESSSTQGKCHFDLS